MSTQILQIVTWTIFATLADAQGWGGNGGDNGGHCPPWLTQDECNQFGAGYGNGGGSSDGNPFANPTLSSDQIATSNKIVTIHAALACVVWVLLIPVGGIIIRSGIKSPWIVRSHAILQSLSFVIYLGAAVLGIWLIREFSWGPNSLWDSSHVRLGMVILVLTLIQPFLGIVHHLRYKRAVGRHQINGTNRMPTKTSTGSAHVWLGRMLIVLGIINGGLGLRLASASPYESKGSTKAVAYGVAASVMALLYIMFIALAERRSNQERKEAARRAADIPMTNTEGIVVAGAAPPLYETGEAPPEYDHYQEGRVKEARTVTRYT